MPPSKQSSRKGWILAALLALAAAAPARGAAPGDEAGGGGAFSAFERLVQGGIAEKDEPFLDPDTAFVLSGMASPEGEEARVRWDIAPGYYLYRERFAFAPARGEAFRIGGVELPAGERKHDAYFGEMEVYYREVEAKLPLLAEEPLRGEARVDVTYQGCADAGLCYPPITRTLVLSLGGPRGTPPGAGPGAGGSAEPLLPWQDRVARSLATGDLPVVIAQFALFGLLLAFTPCVLPMIPILSAIVLGQGGKAGLPRAFALSFVYVLAMALAYTGAGVLAGLSGAGLQAFFQHPVVIVLFSGVFVLLALSMFGFYRLEMPVAWQARLAGLSRRQRGGTWAGVAAMGALSALIVGPCVAPPLAGALIYIARTGDALLGGLALFSLGMGMGVPLLVAGVSAGRLAPVAGPWMRVVERIFGVILIGVAIYLLERVVPPWTALLLWGGLLIVVAIYMGALDHLAAAASGWRRLWKGAGLAMLVYGVLLMVGAAAGGGDPLLPLKGLAARPDTEAALRFKPVKGLEGLGSELAAAGESGRSVMLEFYAEWCVSCKEMEKYTFSDAEVRRALGGTLLLRADVTANDEQDRALLARYELFGPPAVLFFGPDGRERTRFRVVGFVGAARFRRVVEDALAPGLPMVSASVPGQGFGSRRR